jgi:hypothetical protein
MFHNFDVAGLATKSNIMKHKFLIGVVLLFSMAETSDAQFSNLVVSYDQCNPGTTWSGWRTNTRPSFSFNFSYPYTLVEINVRSSDGSYNVVRPFTGPAGCFTWPEDLPSGTYSWNVRVYFQMPPSPYVWSPTEVGSGFHVDITAPNPPAVTENNCGGSSSGWPAWVTGKVPRFTWPAASDAHSGINRYEVSVNSGSYFTVASGWQQAYEGGLTFRFRSVDNVGNVSANSTIYVRIDNTSPSNPSVTEAHCGPQGLWTSHTSPYFTWMPIIDNGYPLNGSGVNRYEVSVNSGTYQTVSPGWHPTFGTGQHTFVFRTVDNVGLASGGTGYVVYIDDTRPNRPIVTEHNCNGSSTVEPPWSNSPSPLFTWDNPGDAGSGIPANGYSASINEGAWATVASGWNPSPGEGSHKIWFRSTDRVGHISDTTVVFVRIDLTPPVADAGDDIITVKYEPVTFSGAGSTDNTAITGYTWDFNDGTGTIILTGVSPTHTFNIAGSYEVTLTVRDEAGNEHSDALTVTVNIPTSVMSSVEEEIRVYPVPAGSMINVDLPDIISAPDKVTYDIISQSGSTVMTGTLKGSQSVIYIGNAMSGLYTIVIRVNGIVVASKQVIKR